jgi:hypothetical protein
MWLRSPRHIGRWRQRYGSASAQNAVQRVWVRGRRSGFRCHHSKIERDCDSAHERDYVGDSLRAMNQKDFAPKGQEKGTYTVNPDCTGSVVINLNAPVLMGSTGVINIMCVISDGGRHIHEVVSEFTPPGLLPAPRPPRPAPTTGRSRRIGSTEPFNASSGPPAMGSPSQLTRLGRQLC